MLCESKKSTLFFYDKVAYNATGKTSALEGLYVFYP